MKWITPSKTFLGFWLALGVGCVIGKYFQLPINIVAWFGIVWLLILWSQQDEPISLLAATMLGISAGFLLWQKTGGESWLHISYLGILSDKLIIVRDAIVSKIYLALPEPAGSLLSGILFGNKVKLDQNLINQFRIVGLTHIIAVSGYNLTILTANIKTIFRPYFGRKVILLNVAVIILFILISGAPASILRAGVMAGLLLVGEIIGRPVKPLNILIIGAGVLTIFEPKIIFDIGFILSVASTYGLMRVCDIFDNGLKKVLPLETFRGVLSETLAATLMTAPIILVVFSRLSIVSPISNILVLPLIPMLMGFGIIGCILVFLVPAIGNWLIFITWPILQWIIFITNKLAGLSFAVWNIGLASWVGAVITLTFICVFEFLASRQPVEALDTIKL